MLWTLTNGMLVSDRAPVAWVDTCVLLDLYSAKDLIEAKRQHNPTDVEYRRVRTRSALWMATVFSTGNALTLGYRHEFEKNLKDHMDADPELAKWSYVLGLLFHKCGVFDGWIGGATSAAGELKNKDRDQFMRNQCLERGMVYITEDADSFKRAQTMGVDAKRPAEFAVTLMPFEVARSQFKQRLEIATARLVVETPEQHREQREHDMLGVRALYDAIWSLVPNALASSSSPTST